MHLIKCLLFITGPEISEPQTEGLVDVAESIGTNVDAESDGASEAVEVNESVNQAHVDREFDGVMETVDRTEGTIEMVAGNEINEEENQMITGSNVSDKANENNFKDAEGMNSFTFLKRMLLTCIKYLLLTCLFCINRQLVVQRSLKSYTVSVSERRDNETL
jgi:hypothetical protein